MKQKFLICIAGCLILMVTNAQGQNADGKSNLKQTEPTVNGIPYSQYKAQQDALKQQEAAKRQLASTVYSEKTMTISETPVKPVAPAATKKVDEREVTKTVSEIVKPADIISTNQVNAPATVSVLSPDVAMPSSKNTVAPATVSNKVVTPTQEDKSVYQQAKRTPAKTEALDAVITAPVKEKPVVTQPTTAPLNLNSSSVRGVTEVPVVEKPVKKD